MAEGGIAAGDGQRGLRGRLEHPLSRHPCAAVSCSTIGAWRKSTPRKLLERVRELEQWGALFDRTQGRADPAARPSAVTPSAGCVM